jgi:glutathione S-transferase
VDRRPDEEGEPGLAAVEREDLSDPCTIGHVTIGCVFGYLDFRFPDDGWRGRHPKLAAWYREVEQLPSMQATKPPAG